MTAPCAIEYILVTRWRGGKKGGQNRVCACDTRDRGVNKKLKPEHPSETVVMRAGPVHADIAADSVDDLPALALAERVGDFNISMDPWEQTGAAPQGWAAHARQTVVPVQGYIQLRPQDTTLPSFGSGPPATAATADTNLSTEVAVRDGGGKASPSVSIFSRSPLCSHTCRHCRSKPCDIATEHDEVTCASIVSRGYYSLREFRSGRCRSCLFAIYGATSVPLNGAALGALISITYAWSEKDEELSSSPPRGARIHGLPVRADLSLEALPSHPHRLSLQRRVVFLAVGVTCGCLPWYV